MNSYDVKLKENSWFDFLFFQTINEISKKYFFFKFFLINFLEN